jgi:hypothetical protein
MPAGWWPGRLQKYAYVPGLSTVNVPTPFSPPLSGDAEWLRDVADDAGVMNGLARGVSKFKWIGWRLLQARSNGTQATEPRGVTVLRRRCLRRKR